MVIPHYLGIQNLKYLMFPHVQSCKYGRFLYKHKVLKFYKFCSCRESHIFWQLSYWNILSRATGTGIWNYWTKHLESQQREQSCISQEDGEYVVGSSIVIPTINKHFMEIICTEWVLFLCRCIYKTSLKHFMIFRAQSLPGVTLFKSMELRQREESGDQHMSRYGLVILKRISWT